MAERGRAGTGDKAKPTDSRYRQWLARLTDTRDERRRTIARIYLPYSRLAQRTGGVTDPS